MAIKQGFIIALLFGIVASSCPRYGVLQGCDCMKGFGSRTIVQCRGENTLKTIEEFRNMLQDHKINTKRIQLNFLNVRRKSNLTSRIFDGFNIEDLSIKFSKISRWADEEGGPAFVGLEDTLQTLYIRESIYKDISDKYKNKAVMSLGHLRKLRTVHFHGNVIHNFGNDWFGEGGSSVEELELERGRLLYIGDQAFAGLTNLKRIEIHGNRVSSVTRSMFPNPANHLSQFHVWNTDLDSLPEDIFTNMPALEDVSVSENRLRQLPESTWRPVWSKLRHLDLRDNHLKCDHESLKWMFEEEKRPVNMEGECYDPKISIYVELRDFLEERNS